MKEKNKKNKWGYGIIVLAFLIVLAVIFIWNTYSSKEDNSNNYQAERTSTEESSNNETEEQNTNESENNTLPQNQPSPSTQPAPPPSPVVREEVLGTFATRIYNKDSARQNNINITCNALNGTTVANGATFSFCNTVGPATSSKGYQKADIFDRNGKKKKGLGGGNCQISSTLYNVVLNIPGLTVTERHQHSNTVPYIQMGKDAAVAYGSYDFKFINQTGSNIKINASTDGNNVNISINKLVQS